ncbi:GNAT family N-acetyltransferase [Rufibacter sp. LB8]|uniref:GNAT family N-acetyltransferase n=1 Tax=Rufibacter sp. LB8 TaxID=2777781 RepID=UPI00178C69A6|nr:GNAT family protein [Rufibacter sp. LB8]
MATNLAVRQLQTQDIPSIVDYWLKADPAFLRGMGVDLQKLPSREGLSHMLTQQINTPLPEKAAYAVIWLLDNQPVGHCNVNNISYGQLAHMHLHLWQPQNWQQGMGTELVKKSLPFFFENLELQDLYCEPYALNPAPSKTLEKVGFTFEKRYVTVPGALNFEQEVNRWHLGRAAYEQIIADISR